MGTVFLCFITILIILTLIAIFYLCSIHKVDRIIQRTWVSVVLVLLGTIYILLGFFVIDCVIHHNYNPSLHDFVRLYGMFSQTNSAYSAEPSEPEPFYIMLSFIGAVTFSGLMISAFNNMYNQRIYRLREGLVSYKFSDHVVIIGGNSTLLTIINSVSKTNNSLETNKKRKPKIPRILVVSSKRPSELAYIKDCIKPEVWNNINFLNDNILLPLLDKNLANHYLSRCRVNNAREIYIIGDKETGKSDTDNLSILHHLLNYYNFSYQGNYPWTKNCFVAYSNLEMLITSIREYEDKNYHGILKHVHVMPYDFNLLLASKVWGAAVSSKSDYLPLAPSEDHKCNIVIIGFNEIAQGMLKMAILKCHFCKDDYTKITVYFSSRDAESVDLFKSNYNILSLTDITVEFKKIDQLQCANVYTEYLEKINFPTIVLCDECIDVNVQMAYAIKKEIPSSDILIYSATPMLQSLASDNTGKKRSGFKFFGNLNQGIELNLLYKKCIFLYMIRNYISRLAQSGDTIENIYLLPKEELMQEWASAEQRFFSLCFDNVKWRLMSMIESFFSLTGNGHTHHDDEKYNITDQCITNQYIASLVLSGYIVDNNKTSQLDKKEAFSRKIIGTSNLDINRVQTMIDVYNKLNESYNRSVDK